MVGKFPPVGLIDKGVLAYALIFVMVLTSNRKVWMGRRWKRLHRVGMWLLLAIFLQPEQGLFPAIYVSVSFLALCLRITAWWYSRSKRKMTVSI